MTADPTRHDDTIPALDGMRALAILLVLASHVGLQDVVPGRFGVTLFFFLSGFLITTLLRRELEAKDGIDFGRFYLRRAVRILPPLYLTMLFMLVLSAARLIPAVNVNAMPYDFLFLTNYFNLSHMPISLWSLCVEEHFYFAFPLIILLLSRRLSFAACAAVFMAVCAVALAVRFWEVSRLADLNNVNFWTHTRLDSILFGSVLALWNNPVSSDRDVLPGRVTSYVLAAALLLPTFLIRDEAFRQSLRYTLQGLGLIVLFNAAIRDRAFAAPLLDNPFFKWVAALSYTLYLVHYGLIIAFEAQPEVHTAFGTVGAIVCTFAYAILMRRWVEQPMARWRRHRERERVAAVPTTTAAEAPLSLR